MRAQFITAAEIAEIMGISRSKSYQIVREMNKELKAQGYAAMNPSLSEMAFGFYLEEIR